MIPAPSARDGEDAHYRYQDIVTGQSAGIGSGRYYGYEPELLTCLRETFQRLGYPMDRSNIQPFQGLYEDTMTFEEPVAFAHIDCDWYDSVFTCLSRIVPRLSVGGAVIVDDYLHWSGCNRATNDYLQGCRDGELKVELGPRLRIWRIAT